MISLTKKHATHAHANATRAVPTATPTTAATAAPTTTQHTHDKTAHLQTGGNVRAQTPIKTQPQTANGKIVLVPNVDAVHRRHKIGECG